MSTGGGGGVWPRASRSSAGNLSFFVLFFSRFVSSFFDVATSSVCVCGDGFYFRLSFYVDPCFCCTPRKNVSSFSCQSRELSIDFALVLAIDSLTAEPGTTTTTESTHPTGRPLGRGYRFGRRSLVARLASSIAPPFVAQFGHHTIVYRVLPSFTGFCRILPDFTGFYLVLLGFYWVLPSLNGFYRV